MNKLKFFIVIILTTQFVAQAQVPAEFFTKADDFFKTHVVSGKVDYKTVKSNSGSLDALLEMAKQVQISTDNVKEYQSFWINVYNLSVIKGVTTNYPIKSPLDIAGFFDKIKRNVGGKSITLNDIENKLLRAKFPNESRFHFVLVCAGLGCPPIIAKAYVPATLEAQLQKQTISALTDANFIRVNQNKVKISKIFEWYKGDFTKKGVRLVDYINQYRTQKLPVKAKVSYYPYDWTLNEVK